MVDTTPTVDSTDRTDRTVGTTVITESVIAKIVGIAAREVAGVHSLASVTGPLGAIRDAIGGTDLGQGVSISVGGEQVAVDIALVTEYPVPLHKVAADVRAAVIGAVESLVEMSVTEVNVTVKDVHLASDDTAPDAGSGNGNRTGA